MISLDISVSQAIREVVLQILIEARIEDNAGESRPIRFAEFERADDELKLLGLSLVEGKSLMYEAQHALVKAQAQVFVAASRTCSQCGSSLPIKTTHTIQYRTVFGKVSIDSPQMRVCKCRSGTCSKTFSPLVVALPQRISPKLEYLQGNWTAHLP